MLHVVKPSAGLWREVDPRGLLTSQFSQNFQFQVQSKTLSQKNRVEK